MTIFETIPDPRRTHRGHFKYPMIEIFFLVISATVSRCDDWDDITEFGELKLDWLRKYFPYQHGIPSHDTLERLFEAICPKQFGACFISWASNQFKSIENEVIAFDGKRIRGSAKGSDAAIHMVSAYATQAGITLGQLATEAKSNEITAIPALMDLLDIKDCIVSIDAMGCQRSIAEKVLEKGANYLLAVKGNQSELQSQIENLFEFGCISDTDLQEEVGHGRVEKRRCSTIVELQLAETTANWKGLKTVIRLESERYHKKSGKLEKQTRHYISSSKLTAKDFNRAIRSHWGIENNLHWNLDVVFGEDRSKKKGNCAANFSLILKVALRMLAKAEYHRKLTKPKKRLVSLLSDQFREEVLQII